MKTNNRIKNKNGISLIVLIITIAVVIILAAALILSMNNNRPIESAKTATEKNDIATLKESAGILSAQWEVDKLLDESIGTRIEYVQSGLTKQGFEQSMINKVTIDEETGKVTVLESAKASNVSARDVASAPQKYYGAYVTNYEAEYANLVGWKILYSDGNNIYLIADDCIPYENIPYSTKNGVSTSNKPDMASEELQNFYGVNSICDYSNILGDYTGINDITDSRLIKLNSKYHEYIKNNSVEIRRDNMKVIAYLMDTLAWNKFAGEKAEYAIGGPTLELIINSYNQKYPSVSPKIEYQVADGYTIDELGSTIGAHRNFYGVDGYSFISERKFYVGTQMSIKDKLYINGENSEHGFWLSSPISSSTTIYVCGVLNDGRIGDFDRSLGLRPLVCLKSDIILDEQDDGTFIIIE